MNFSDVINLDTPSGNIKKISVGGIDLWSAPVADLFVASWGNDTTGDGSVMNPFKTVTAAFSAASDDDVIMLLTDVEDSFAPRTAKNLTICGFKKSVVFLNHSRLSYSATGYYLTIKDLTYTTDYVGSDGAGAMAVGGGAKLTLSNIRFTNCNTYRPSGAACRTPLIRANGGEFHAIDLSIDNSTVLSLITYRDSTKVGTIENIVCGENCEFVGWNGTKAENGALIGLGWNGSYALQKLSGITLNECQINLNGYYSSINTYADHIYGNGTIYLGHHAYVTILSDVNITGKIDCRKAHGLNGSIRGNISLVDAYRTAADGNVFFESYDSYQITQEDFASMTWGGTEGFHLSLEDNQILLRADA